jgi:hypothetical protein
MQGYKQLQHNPSDNEHPPRVYSLGDVVPIYESQHTVQSEPSVGFIVPLNAGARRNHYNAVAAVYYLDPNIVYSHPTLNPS